MLNSKITSINLWKKERYKCPDEDSVTKNIILPIFNSMGWYENRGLKRNINNRDITIENGNVTVIMECKKINKEEFNIFENTGALQSNGKNYPGDGVGQLRHYCVIYMKAHPIKEIIPIFSNGLRWIVFNKNSFLDNNKLYSSIKPARDIIFDELINEKCFIKKLQRKLKHLGFAPKLSLI